MDAYKIVRDFEEALSHWAGAKHCVTVDSCTNALFLVLMYHKQRSGQIEITLPRYTYPGVAAAVVHAGHRLTFDDFSWQTTGLYSLRPLPVLDSAKHLCRNMYPNVTNEYGYHHDICVSFHARKPLAIGRGGAILTDSSPLAKWLRCARFDGRHECALETDTLEMAGWNMYMSPEQAARGLHLLSILPEHNVAPADPYQDLSQYSFFTKANR